MDDQYAKIGKQFQKTAPKALLRASLLTPTFVEIIGNISGKSCLDLACGDGYYTRILKEHRAKKVVGVDISSTMIELAKKAEDKLNRGIEYIVGDVATLYSLGEFDLVTAVSTTLCKFQRKTPEYVQRHIQKHQEIWQIYNYQHQPRLPYS